MKKMAGFLLGVLAILIVAASAFIYSHYFGRPAPKGNLVPLKIGTAAFQVELATSTLAQTRGLSGRVSLPEGEGMLFVYDTPGNYGFWMKDMNFPLDFVWIREGKVVGTTENVAPEPEKALWRLTIYYPPSFADQILELNAGDVARYGIKTGDPVEVTLP